MVCKPSSKGLPIQVEIKVMVHNKVKSLKQLVMTSGGMLVGTFLAAFALKVILMPNKIIDGGVIGVSIIVSELYGDHLLYPLVLILNIPFFNSYRFISRALVGSDVFSVPSFKRLFAMDLHSPFVFLRAAIGDLLEIVVIGGVMLGVGVGLIIRWGGCLDGTEIMGGFFK